MRQVTVSIPATTANLGPGYDCLGLALDLRHQVTLRALEEEALRFRAAGEDAHKIPLDEENLVYQAAQLVFKRLQWRPPGLLIEQENKIPIASGLGSSSSAVLAGLFGANALAGSPLSRQEILQMATDFEGHPDNVAPAVYGGLILGVQGAQGLIVESIPIPTLHVVVVLPDFELLTADARAALPEKVSREDAIFNASRTALLIRALRMGDYKLLGEAMRDRLHQPYRIPLIPGMAEALAAAKEAGASGVALSGAGPSLIAFAATGHQAIAATAAAAFERAGYSSRIWNLATDTTGVTLS